jgi:hypothetical protein
VRDFQAQPNFYSLNDWNDNPHGIGYGPVYLFTVYLVDRFGEGILRELVSSPEVGFPNLEARLKAHGSRFSDFFTDWAATNMVDHQPNMPPHLTYKLLDMHGSYGGTILTGFYATPQLRPSTATLAMRPCSLFYADMGDGNGVPAFQTSNQVTREAPLGP